LPTAPEGGGGTIPPARGYNLAKTCNALFGLMNRPLIPGKYASKWDHGEDK